MLALALAQSLPQSHVLQTKADAHTKPLVSLESVAKVSKTSARVGCGLWAVGCGLSPNSSKSNLQQQQ